MLTLAAFLHAGKKAAARKIRAPSIVTLSPNFHRGVNYAHVHRRGHGYGSPVSAKELRALQSLGVAWIALTPFAYQSHAAADSLVGFGDRPGATEFFSRHDPSLTDEDIKRQIEAAHALGMKVTLKPQIWSGDFWKGDEWHGSLRQTSPAAHEKWWQDYSAFITHYARLATLTRADLLCLGTEMVSLTARYPREWEGLIKKIRTVYAGPLTYAAHWQSEFQDIVFWPLLDFIGVNVYFPLEAPEEASVDELVKAWQPHRRRLAEVARAVGKPVLFMEMGYRPVLGTHRKPWEYRGGVFNPAAQVRAYEAMFSAFGSDRWWKGVYVWKAFTDPDMGDRHLRERGFAFRGLPAESVLRRWFSRR